MSSTPRDLQFLDFSGVTDDVRESILALFSGANPAVLVPVNDALQAPVASTNHSPVEHPPVTPSPTSITPSPTPGTLVVTPKNVSGSSTPTAATPVSFPVTLSATAAPVTFPTVSVSQASASVSQSACTPVSYSPDNTQAKNGTAADIPTTQADAPTSIPITSAKTSYQREQKDPEINEEQQAENRISTQHAAENSKSDVENNSTPVPAPSTSSAPSATPSSAVDAGLARSFMLPPPNMTGGGQQVYPPYPSPSPNNPPLYNPHMPPPSHPPPPNSVYTQIPTHPPPPVLPHGATVYVANCHVNLSPYGGAQPQVQTNPGPSQSPPAPQMMSSLPPMLTEPPPQHITGKPHENDRRYEPSRGGHHRGRGRGRGRGKRVLDRSTSSDHPYAETVPGYGPAGQYIYPNMPYQVRGGGPYPYPGVPAPQTVQGVPLMYSQPQYVQYPGLMPYQHQGASQHPPPSHLHHIHPPMPQHYHHPGPETPHHQQPHHYPAHHQVFESESLSNSLASTPTSLAEPYSHQYTPQSRSEPPPIEQVTQEKVEEDVAQEEDAQDSDTQTRAEVNENQTTQNSVQQNQAPVQLNQAQVQQNQAPVQQTPAPVTPVQQNQASVQPNLSPQSSLNQAIQTPVLQNQAVQNSVQQNQAPVQKIQTPQASLTQAIQTPQANQTRAQSQSPVFEPTVVQASNQTEQQETQQQQTTQQQIQTPQQQTTQPQIQTQTTQPHQTQPQIQTQQQAQTQQQIQTPQQQTTQQQIQPQAQQQTTQQQIQTPQQPQTQPQIQTPQQTTQQPQIQPQTPQQQQPPQPQIQPQTTQPRSTKSDIQSVTSGISQIAIDESVESIQPTKKQSARRSGPQLASQLGSQIDVPPQRTRSEKPAVTIGLDQTSVPDISFMSDEIQPNVEPDVGLDFGIGDDILPANQEPGGITFMGPPVASEIIIDPIEKVTGSKSVAVEIAQVIPVSKAMQSPVVISTVPKQAAVKQTTQAPVKQATVPVAPVKQATQSTVAPVKQATVPVAPVSKATQSQVAPVKQAPIPVAPVRQATVPVAPVKQATQSTVTPQATQTPIPPVKQPAVPEESVKKMVQATEPKDPEPVPAAAPVPTPVQEPALPPAPVPVEAPVATPPGGAWAQKKSWSQLFKPCEGAAKQVAYVAPFNQAEKPRETTPSPLEPPRTVPETPLLSEADVEKAKIGAMLKNYIQDHRQVALQPRGLTNKGYWCYVNAPLQALLACPPFYNLIHSIPNIPGLKKGKSSTPVIDSIVEYIHEFAEIGPTLKPTRKEKNQGNSGARKDQEIIPGPAFEPSYIYKMLATMNGEMFKDGRQQDAEEMLSFVLNALHDEMVEALKLAGDGATPSRDTPVNGSTNGDTNMSDVESDSDEWQVMGPRKRCCVTRTASFTPSPISAIFWGQLRSILHQAGLTTANLQPFTTLPLDIQSSKVESVKDALEQLVSREEIPDYTDAKTNQDVTVYKQVVLENLPSILILQLKCFIYDKDGGLQKVIKKVNFPIDLEITKELMSSQSRNKFSALQRKYKLLAVVYHDGKEATKGHYVADIYHGGYSCWLRCDDSYIKEIPENNVVRHVPPRVPYLLFYRRADTMVGPSKSKS